MQTSTFIEHVTERDDKAHVLGTLSKAFEKRKCHTMASEIRLAAEGDSKALENLQSLWESPFFESARKHNKSQDALAGLVDLANFVIDVPTPMAVGEELVRRIDMETQTRKVRIREPAIAHRTARGRPHRGRGRRSRYVELKPDDEIESHSSWDRNFLEDADWSVATEEASGIAEELREVTSQTILDAIKAIPVGSTTTEQLVAPGTANTLGFNDVVDMRQNMLAKYVRPNRMVMNPLQTADLLKEEVFQDSLRYGDFVNKGEGYIGSLFGMDIYESAQMTDGHMWMLDVRYTMLFGVRRYMMMERFEEVDDGKSEYGVKISTRYDLKVGLGTYISRMEGA